nr:putative retrotransposon Ty1-copia subclass protein [Tanacetum cinerariifolium]
ESGRIVELEDEDILPSENTSEHPIEEGSLAPIVSQEEDVIPVHRSVRTHKAPDRLCLNVEIDPDRVCFHIEVEEHSLGDLNEPANYKAALSGPEFEKWPVAMNAEMQSMYDNKVWRLVVLSPNAKVVKSKWIYKKKTDMDGKVHIYKAQLVAKGCTQTYDVDYEETFSHVADIRAIRILIAISTYYDYKIWQMDVKTAFLNGFLEEEIYMEQPEGFIDPNHPRKVCKLQRSIYGLNQTSRSWNKRFDEEIKKDEAYAEYPYASAVGSIMFASYELTVIAMLDSKPIEMTRNLKLVPLNDYPIKMNCDNSAAIIMAKESGIQKGARHFKRKYHYVRECIKIGEIDIVKVHTDDNLADPFMKALAGPKLTQHAISMGLHPASSFM